MFYAHACKKWIQECNRKIQKQRIKKSLCQMTLNCSKLTQCKETSKKRKKMNAILMIKAEDAAH